MMIKTKATADVVQTVFDKIPSTVCNGFLDVHGVWNNGFSCPIENSVQYFCCGTDNHFYCCPPDRYSFESKLRMNTNHVVDEAETFDSILTDEISMSLINNQKLINKQFQQFQKYFLPTFLLTTTILFLLGIALWFWLYKHKTYYAITRDDRRTLSRVPMDTPTTLEERNNIRTNLKLPSPSPSSNPSTTV